ncbi:MAG: poly(R)-hydroxyalkanoic acid synthase subunit PhaE [Flavipsychrobacter sp.]
MANQDSKNFVESVVDAQKQAVDSVVENTKKLSNGNALVNDTLAKGSEWYKNWLDNQKGFFSNASEKATNMGTNVQDNASKMNEFYQNWFNTQMDWAKQMWEMNMNFMKTNIPQQPTTANPMEQWSAMWNNATTNWNNWTNNMQQFNNWMNWANNFQNMNPMNMDSWKKASENYTGIFNQYYDMLKSGFADMQKNMQNGTTQEAYRNMINVSEGFTRFAEFWAPFWKSIQEKTFNNDLYKQYMNPSLYKELMDKYFGFMPDNSRQYMQQMTDMMQKGFGQASQAGMNNYQQIRSAMTSMMPSANEMFANMMNGYNAWYNMMSNAAAPLTKMMTPNQFTKTMMEWNDISNRIMVYNIKNAELQYMIYNQGTKVMDSLAENVAAKLQNGGEINNMVALYQEWLNISDKVYVSLFESEVYSKLMAEVSAMQLRLRKDIEAQMEKYMIGIPVATRSEMDEIYKTIYDLKKQVRQLEKMLEIENTEDNSEEKAARKTKKA